MDKFLDKIMIIFAGVWKVITTIIVAIVIIFLVVALSRSNNKLPQVECVNLGVEELLTE